MITLKCYNGVKNLENYVGKRVRIFYNNVDFGLGVVIATKRSCPDPNGVYKLWNSIDVNAEDEDRLLKYVHCWADEGGVSKLEEIT